MGHFLIVIFILNSHLIQTTSVGMASVSFTQALTSLDPKIRFNEKDGTYRSFVHVKAGIDPNIQAETFRSSLGESYQVTLDGKALVIKPSLSLLWSHLLHHPHPVSPTSHPIKGSDLPETIILDYSSPNIAKAMHVGHLRSTILGDCLARVFEAEGHTVKRINHLGDFGTHFGMLIETLNAKGEGVTTIEALQEVYKEGKARYAFDEEFAKACRERVVSFQAGDPSSSEAWKDICKVSMEGFDAIYDRLGVHLEVVGESFYQPLIPPLLDSLKDHMVNNDGRLQMGIPEEKVPLTLVKSDGGYTYDTTDLTALHHRIFDQGANRIYYVVDNGQALHFRVLFGVASSLGWISDSHDIRHVGFGIVLGEDKKRLRSSSGESIPLKSLLDEALVQTQRVLCEGNSTGLDEETLMANVPKMAYAAVKYADLSVQRHADYVFSFDRMLSLKGNTALYLLYAFVRIGSILRKAKSHGISLDGLIGSDDSPFPDHPNFYLLLAHFCTWEATWESTVTRLEPHHLCTFVYKLATIFHKFVTTSRVLSFHPEDPELLISYSSKALYLAVRTHSLMAFIFHLLGLPTMDRL